MTAGYPSRWYKPASTPADVNRGDDDPLLARIRAEEAEDAELAARYAPACTCMVIDGRGKPEFYPDHCGLHRDAYLNEIDQGVHDDDKRETPGRVA